MSPNDDASHLGGDDVRPLDTQVAGHDAGVYAMSDGRMMKPCLPRELEFYSHLPKDHALRHFMPRFYGTLDLPPPPPPATPHLSRAADPSQATQQQQQQQQQQQHPPPPPPAPRRHERAIVLQNLTHGFVRPNVCDVKLGTQLWDDDATDEKRARMDAQARETTSFEHGVRMTGWQVHTHDGRTLLRCPKAFGKALRSYDELLLSFRLFFGLAARASDRTLLAEVTSRYAAAARRDEDDDGAGKEEEGRRTEELGAGTEPWRADDADAVRALLEDLLAPRLGALEEVLSRTAWRARGASLLIVYESDPASLRRRLASASAATGAAAAAAATEPSGAPPLQVHLIDFAHARLVPEEEGPDLGVLKGVATVRRMVRDCREALRGASSGPSSTKG